MRRVDVKFLSELLRVVQELQIGGTCRPRELMIAESARILDPQNGD
jgi:hypothetical protein